MDCLTSEDEDSDSSERITSLRSWINLFEENGNGTKTERVVVVVITTLQTVGGVEGRDEKEETRDEEIGGWCVVDTNEKEVESLDWCCCCCWSAKEDGVGLQDEKGEGGSQTMGVLVSSSCIIGIVVE